MALPLPTPECVDCGLPADVLNEEREPVCASCLDRADAHAELQAMLWEDPPDRQPRGMERDKNDDWNAKRER